MKKTAVYISILILSLVLLSSCQSNNVEKESKSDQTKPVTLNFSTFYEDGAEADAYKEIIESYEASHKNITVNLISGAVNYDEKIKNSLSQGKGPDIMGLQRSIMLDYINQGYIKNISGIIESEGFKKNYYGVSIGYGKSNGKYYGIGDMPSPTVWYYNVDLFKKAGVESPKDLNELISICNKLKRFTQYPIMIGSKDSWVMNTLFGMITVQTVDTNELSTAFSKNDKTALLNLKGANNAVDILNQLIKSGAINENVLEYDYAASVDAFVKGKAAIFPMGSWAAERIEKNKPKGFNYKTFDNSVLFVQNPNSKYSATSVQVVTLNANSKYPKQSEEFMKYLFSEEAQKIFASKNGISSLKSANTGSADTSQAKAQMLKYLENTDENSTMYIDNISRKAMDITADWLRQMIEGRVKPSEVWQLITNQYIS